MNILLTSAGIRGYLVEYFREALAGTGQVIAVDARADAPALYAADAARVVPALDDPEEFLETLEAICREFQIHGIIPLSDLDLPVLAAEKSRFEALGARVIVSDGRVIELCTDKYATDQFLRSIGVGTPPTFITLETALAALDLGRIHLPLVVKPRRGSASQGLRILRSRQALVSGGVATGDEIVQEFIEGTEYGVDVLCDATGTPVSVRCKRKIRMRAGETDKAVSEFNDKVVQATLTAARALGVYGPMDADVLERKGQPFVLDINARFAGGYPFSHAVGADFPRKILSLIRGVPIEADLDAGPQGVLMMKEPRIVVRAPTALAPPVVTGRPTARIGMA